MDVSCTVEAEPTGVIDNGGLLLAFTSRTQQGDVVFTFGAYPETVRGVLVTLWASVEHVYSAVTEMKANMYMYADLTQKQRINKLNALFITKTQSFFFRAGNSL